MLGKHGHLLIGIALSLLLADRSAFAASVDKNWWISGSPTVIAAAVQSGVELNTRDESGNTPLIYAARHNTADAVNVLLAGGAKPDFRNIRGFTPLMFAALYSRDTAVLDALLLYRADIDAADDQGRTALMHAAAFRDVSRSEAIVFLLEKGANPFLADGAGRTALDHAQNNTVLAHSAGLAQLRRYSDHARSPYVERAAPAPAPKPEKREPAFDAVSAPPAVLTTAVSGSVPEPQGAAPGKTDAEPPRPPRHDPPAPPVPQGADAVSASSAALLPPANPGAAGAAPSPVVVNIVPSEKNWLDYAEQTFQVVASIAAVAVALGFPAFYRKRKGKKDNNIHT